MPVSSYFEESYSPGTTQIIIRSGFNYVDACVVGGGGAGRKGGGGAGGVASKTFQVRESEWGGYLTCSFGVAVSSAAGTATTLNGTLNGAAITELKGFGGARGGLSLGGAGGSHSGGDATAWPNENHSGGSGGDYDVDLDQGGAAGVPGADIYSPTGYFANGSGGAGNSDPTLAGDGVDGALLLRWKV